MRVLVAAALTFAVSNMTHAGEKSATGHWKVIIHERLGQSTYWLLHLETKDGKLTGTVDNLRGAPPATVEKAKVTGETLAFQLHAKIRGDDVIFDFEGKISKVGGRVLGAFTVEETTVLASLEATKAKNLFELDRETLKNTPNDPRAALAIFDLIERAREHKLEAKELQDLVQASLKNAEQFGARYQAQHQIRLLERLRPQKNYMPVAVDVAKRLSKQLDTKAPVDAQVEVLSSIVDVLRLAGQGDADLERKLDKLEGDAFAHHSKEGPGFATFKFGGRKAKSNRAVLVELFTGAQCPPCVAADLAFDALAKTYGPGEVVLLQYHMHIPRPDPMSTPDGDARYDFYAESGFAKIGGTPAILFNGKTEGFVGGPREEASKRYKDYSDHVTKLLEAAPGAKLAAVAVRKGDNIAILAQVDELEKPGEKVRLRFALVEDWVRYKGTNGLAYHHRVVRAMPGGARGFPIKDKSQEQVVDVKLDDVRKTLNKYLDEAYPDGPRPMRMQELRVVAFVQNDETGEILQAIDVPVRMGK